MRNDLLSEAQSDANILLIWQHKKAQNIVMRLILQPPQAWRSPARPERGYWWNSLTTSGSYQAPLFRMLPEEKANTTSGPNFSGLIFQTVGSDRPGCESQLCHCTSLMTWGLPLTHWATGFLIWKNEENNPRYCMGCLYTIQHAKPTRMPAAQMPWMSPHSFPSPPSHALCPIPGLLHPSCTREAF